MQYIFSGEDYKKKYNTMTEDLTENNHIENKGGIVILYSDKKIISSTKEYSNKEFNIDILDRNDKNDFFIADPYNIKSFCYVSKYYDYTFLAFYTFSDFFPNYILTVFLFCIMELVLFLFMFYCILSLNKKVVTKNIAKVNESLNLISNGNLDILVDVKTNKEFTQLSKDINKTVDTLKGYIKKNPKEFNVIWSLQI